MKNVLKRCISLITLFNSHSSHLTTDYIKDNLEEYRYLSDSAFKRSFERDKVLLRDMGYNLDYKNDKWSIDEGYNISGTTIINEIKKNPKINLNNFINTYHLIKNKIDSNYESSENLIYISKLKEAINKRNRVSFEYNNKLRKVYPMGIRFHNQNWYLGAEDNKILKTFKLSNLENLKIGNKSELHEKKYNKIQFSWEVKDHLIDINVLIEKDIYTIYKYVFNHTISKKEYDNELISLDIKTHDIFGLSKFLLLSNPKKIKLNKKNKELLLEVLNE